MSSLCCWMWFCCCVVLGLPTLHLQSLLPYLLYVRDFWTYFKCQSFEASVCCCENWVLTEYSHKQQYHKVPVYGQVCGGEGYVGFHFPYRILSSTLKRVCVWYGCCIMQWDAMVRQLYLVRVHTYCNLFRRDTQKHTGSCVPDQTRRVSEGVSEDVLYYRLQESTQSCKK